MVRYTFIFLLFFVFISQTLPDSRAEQPSSEPTKYYLKSYNFSTDWFTRHIPVWNKILRPFKGKADIHYLEIGVFEGRSAIWMLENILTHPSSKLTGIDIFQFGNGLKEKYLSNLKMSGFAHKATTIQGYSQIELRNLPLNSFDIIYIDACHRADCTLANAALSFELLKTYGLLIFDDYTWGEELPEELRTQFAIDSFITAYRNFIEIVHRDYQVFIRKRKNPYAHFRSPPKGCSPVGQYVYVWNWMEMNELYPQDMSKPIKLSDKEKLLIERLIKSTKFGSTKLFLDRGMSKDKAFINLSERLKLDFTNIEIRQETRFLEGLRRRLFSSSPD